MCKENSIIITCTEEQAEYIKDGECIAFNDDICECDRCVDCPYDPRNIKFIIKN